MRGGRCKCVHQQLKTLLLNINISDVEPDDFNFIVLELLFLSRILGDS